MMRTVTRLAAAGFCVTGMVSGTVAMAQDGARAASDLDRLIQQTQDAAKKARDDARTAEESAAKAEALVRQLIELRDGPPRREAAADPARQTICAQGDEMPLLDTAGGLDQFIRCTGRVVRLTDGRRQGDDAPGAEAIVIANLPAVSASGGAKPGSLAYGDSGFVGSLSAAKEGETVALSYNFPLSRRKNLYDVGTVDERQRAIVTSLTLGFSATFNKDVDGGLLTDFTEHTDKPIGVSLSIGRQYYPSRKSLGVGAGGEKSVEQLGGKAVGDIIALCNADRAAGGAAQKTEVAIFGNSLGTPIPAALPQQCRGRQLVEWLFETDKDGSFKHPDAVTLYNSAFWLAPGGKELPEYGFGATGTISRERFSHIDPANLPAGTIINPGGDPPLLSTLDPKALGGQKDTRYDWSVGGYVFRHWSGKWGPFKGLTIKPSFSYGREWSIDKDASDIEFCSVKIPRIGEVVVPNADTRSCSTLNVAAPIAKSGLEFKLQARTQVNFFSRVGWLPGIGFGPSIGYSDIKDRYQVIAPVYLSFDDKGFNGGVRYSHEWGGGEEAESVLAIFYSTPFTLAGHK
jgi:hypothetical protein